jgi:hypothetical protein
MSTGSIQMRRSRRSGRISAGSGDWRSASQAEQRKSMEMVVAEERSRESGFSFQDSRTSSPRGFWRRELKRSTTGRFASSCPARLFLNLLRPDRCWQAVGEITSICLQRAPRSACGFDNWLMKPEDSRAEIDCTRSLLMQALPCDPGAVRDWLNERRSLLGVAGAGKIRAWCCTADLAVRLIRWDVQVEAH